MFSEELAILDRNTVKYMMDEMQSEIDSLRGTIEKQANELEEKQATIHKMHNKYTESLREINDKYIESLQNTISILRSINMPESEIISKMCGKYQISEEQFRQYL